MPNISISHVQLKCEGQTFTTTVEVILDGQPALLGYQDCLGLGLEKQVYTEAAETIIPKSSATTLKEQVQQTHPLLFTGLGCLPGMHTIQLREDSVPVIHAFQRRQVAKSDYA